MPENQVLKDPSADGGWKHYKLATACALKSAGTADARRQNELFRKMMTE